MTGRVGGEYRLTGRVGGGEYRLTDRMGGRIQVGWQGGGRIQVDWQDEGLYTG